MTDLTEQNQRLTAQLREASNTEKELRDQLSKIRDQVKSRKTSMQVSAVENQEGRKGWLVVDRRKKDQRRRSRPTWAVNHVICGVTLKIVCIFFFYFLPYPTQVYKDTCALFRLQRTKYRPRSDT